jgi:hypothetical protein
VCVVHLISGELDHAAEGDTLVASGSIELVPRAPTRVAIAQITAR